jgi:hypothetical protein
VNGLGKLLGITSYMAIRGQQGWRSCVPERAGGRELWAGENVVAFEPFSAQPRPKSKAPEHAMNNASMFTADRATHLKIVVVSLLCATVVAGIGIAARVTDTSNVRMEASVIKAGKPVTAATNDGNSIR